ncbi:hypothetical protein RND81_01G045800 [Saponaria officinalis]|uniref:Uncharacterized protein n=1 Tax=Saponaria officinalis TaxID=3572 RepID=A0AAW1NCZ5_SAPOF
MKWEMEVLSTYLTSASWLIDESRAAKWTQAENKVFENALAVYDKDTPDRWQKVAAMLPGKTVGDIIKQYRELEDDVSNIEAGLIPIPSGYDTSSAFTLDWVNHNGYDGCRNTYIPGSKRGPRGRPVDQERKKGVPWTEDEHKLFLMGLKKYGKGDWRNISRNFVITRTPTQVASHAQKYFMRQLSGGKDKRRASIHDITTVNLQNEPLSPDTNCTSKMSNSPDHSVISGQTQHHQTTTTTTTTISPSMPKTHFQWGQTNNGPVMGFESMDGNVFVSPYENGSYGFNMQGHNLLDNYLGTQGMGF